MKKKYRKIIKKKFLELKNGFSLVEISIALLVISVIAAALTPTISKRLTSTSTIKNRISTKCNNVCADGFCAMCYVNPKSCIVYTKECAKNQFKDVANCACINCSDAYGANCTLCNSKECTQCAPGYYKDTKTNLCIKCPKGFYCFQDPITGASTMKKCPQGTSQPSEGQASCVKCQQSTATTAGSVQTQEGQTSCTPCAAGSYASAEGQKTACEPCDAGYYCPQGKHIPCPLGTSNGAKGQTVCTNCIKSTTTTAGSVATTTALTSCAICPDGKYASTAAQGRACDVCPKGSYCKGGKINPCPVGQISNSTGQTACVKCAQSTSSTVGTISNKAGSSVCTACGNGKYTATSGQTACNNCLPGYRCPDGKLIKCTIGTYATGSASVCTSCGNGKTSQAGAKSCVTCSTGCSQCYETAGYCTSCNQGYYKSGTSCLRCPAGWYCPGGTAASTKCPAGSYSSIGASSCTSCGSGKTSSAGSSTCISCSSNCTECSGSAGNCTSCKAGYYKSGSSCVKCSAGYSCAGGTAGQVKCPTGTTSSAGSSACTTCAAGCTSCSGSASNCTSCKAGTYLSGSSCKTCSVGYYCLGGSSGQSKCPAGQTAPAGSASSGMCTSCKAGCSSCSGTTTNCTACSAGYYISGSSCQSCTAGYYCPGGTDSRRKCPVGQYSASGSSGCKSCQSNQSSSEGSSSCFSCTKYHAKCVECNATSCTKCGDGYEVDGATKKCKAKDCSSVGGGDLIGGKCIKYGVFEGTSTSVSYVASKKCSDLGGGWREATLLEMCQSVWADNGMRAVWKMGGINVYQRTIFAHQGYYNSSSETCYCQPAGHAYGVVSYFASPIKDCCIFEAKSESTYAAWVCTHEL